MGEERRCTMKGRTVRVQRLLLILLGAAWVASGCGEDHLNPPRDVAARTSPPVEVTAGEPVPGQYIVVLHAGVPLEDVLSATPVTELLHTYQYALNGFAAVLSDEQLAALERHPGVRYVEPDRYVTLVDDRVTFEPIDDKGGKGGEVAAAGPQTVPTGVNRIDADLSPTAKINGSDERVNADVAVIDTGIQLNHPDLYVFSNVTFVKGTKTGNDDNGHGTHVAGTVAALDNGAGVVGVAPGARLWAVKVLNRNGSGLLSDVIKGVDYVTQNAASIEVANMSLSGGNSTALNDAIKNSVAKGVVYVVAAGNSSTDASNTSPANSPDVLAVSAIADSDGQGGGTGSPTSYGADDSFATFSNYGSVVDIAAPGVDILSTYKGSSYAKGSGTSMASPHVAGVAALYLATHGKPTDASGVAAVREAVIGAGFPQSDPNGFTGDPDGFPEPLAKASAF